MRIVCPTCSAVYEVPDALLAGGKRTRCARCAREWVPQPVVAAAPPPPRPVVAPPPPPAPPTPVVPPSPPPVVSPVMPPVLPTVAARPARVVAPREEPVRPAKPRRPHGMAVGIALGASVLVLGGLCAAAVVWRAALIGVFPQADRLFLWLGLG